MICTMRLLLLPSAIFGIAWAVPQPPTNHYPNQDQNQSQAQNQNNTPIPIISQKHNQSPDGSYQYGYEAGNGIAVEERGAIKNLGQQDNEINSVQGYFAYPGPDGVQYLVSYTADERGFVPQGAHLPTSPPMPEAIAKALESLPRDNTEYDENGFPISSRNGFQSQQPSGASQSRPTGPSGSSGPSGPSSYGDSTQNFGGGRRRSTKLT